MTQGSSFRSFQAVAIIAAAGMIAALCLPASAQAPPAGSPVPEGIDDISVISVQLDTLTLLSGKEGDIEVLQLLRVVNAGDKPFVGEPVEGGQGGQAQMRRAVFKVPVPEGAFDIAPSDARNPQGMAEGPAGIVTTVPLPPGETLVSYIYRIRPARTGWALRRQIDYPTSSINLLLGPGLRMQSSPGFRFAERKTIGQIEYHRYRGGPFTPGSVLTADVGFGGESPSGIWVQFGSAAAAVTALLLGLGLLHRRRSRGRAGAASQPDNAHENPPATGLEDKPTSSREDLILQIALLDEQFDSGSLAESTYRPRRRELKEKLSAFGESVKQ